MKDLFKNKAMIATMISGILIILGIVLQWQSFDTAAAIIFVLSFIIGGYKQAKEGFLDTFENKHLNVDILMVLAAVGASLIGYWMEGALLIFIFSLSGSLEEYATEKSTQAITALMNIVPEIAKRINPDGSIEDVAVKDLKVGDTLLVPKGASIPIDGTIASGQGLIDEAAISGESVPVEKTVGDDIFGSTINLSEALTMTVSKESKDTLFAKIIRMVEEAQKTPSKTASFINRIENTYVKIVLIFVPVMIAVFYFLLDWGWNESFYRGMVLLTVASPCALVASATPAVLSAISNAAKRGILFKGGIAIENFSAMDCIAFDKTGTLTEGKPVVTEASYLTGTDEKHIMSVVYALEHSSTHPIASALVQHLDTKEYEKSQMDSIQDLTGFGLAGEAFGSHWKIGKKTFVVTDELNEPPFVKEAFALQNEGKTVIYVSQDDKVVAYYALLDTPKSEAKDMIAFFKANGVHTIMITGDNEATGQTIGKQLGVDEIRANCLPEDKTTILKDLQAKYKLVGMVGDGVNDAPALANADIGIAMGEGTDIAMETADVVLMKSELDKLEYCYGLSKKLKKITMQNIIFSITVILILILSNLFQLINLPLGVVGHEGSTILVIMNSLRLLAKIPTHHFQGTAKPAAKTSSTGLAHEK
ncbi:heavy metal translocating P-type ATPase [Trichococcus shcherbakoviae]|uniref:Heavy metal translocating P-type ATPase n=1 Tax=Trichococcus shcherbakoviae subsp. psychrophilus TaxID=2585775 RepID=A0A5C5EB24_9LACT|nr:heavy metal translocating P-type ATPase [Trichococcus shcherbakoviae]TNV69813.1 heavy metal translocating P-type ATPase [Trichococcus shcherbakoviae subsp. psychrophilus]